MRLWAPFATAALATACGGPRSEVTLPRNPCSVHEHLSQARQHESRAKRLEERYRPSKTDDPRKGFECVDQPVNDVAYSGGERLRVLRPCWTSVTKPTSYHLQEAERHRRAAAEHRELAAELLSTERRACAGLGEAEVSRSPFHYRDDIVSVAPLYENGALRGAVVLFRKVPGLTREWMWRSIHCHQARAAVMGYSESFMPTCPVALRGVAASIQDTGEGILVKIRADSEPIAAAVLGRAEDLVKPREKGDILSPSASPPPP